MRNLIDCRKCDSPYCDGCNIYRLARALALGHLDWAMDAHHGIQIDKLREGDPDRVPSESASDHR